MEIAGPRRTPAASETAQTAEQTLEPRATITPETRREGVARAPTDGDRRAQPSEGQLRAGALRDQALYREAQRKKVAAPPPPAAPKPKIAVLLIDAIDTPFWNFPTELVPLEQQRMEKVLRRANATGVPVFEIAFPPWPDTAERFRRLRRPENWVRLEKDRMSAFSNPRLQEELRARGITDVVLMGQYQEHCVRATAVDAVGLGLQVHTSSDLVQKDRPFSAEFAGWEKIIKQVHVASSYSALPIFKASREE